MSDDTQEQNVVDEVEKALRLAEMFDGVDPGLRMCGDKAAMTLAREVRRLRDALDGETEENRMLIAAADEYGKRWETERAQLTENLVKARNAEHAEALRAVHLEADRDQLSASNLRLVAEREQLKSELAACEACYQNRLADVARLTTELERRNVAHVEPAILSKDRDDWKARALTAERERDQVNAKLAAVATLIFMQHADSLISVADIRKALGRE